MLCELEFSADFWLADDNKRHGWLYFPMHFALIARMHISHCFERHQHACTFCDHVLCSLSYNYNVCIQLCHNNIYIYFLTFLFKKKEGASQKRNIAFPGMTMNFGLRVKSVHCLFDESYCGFVWRGVVLFCLKCTFFFLLLFTMSWLLEEAEHLQFLPSCFHLFI